jgi:hypothetical protein
MRDAMNISRKAMRELLVHSLLIGASLFLMFSFMNGSAGGNRTGSSFRRARWSSWLPISPAPGCGLRRKMK